MYFFQLAEQKLVIDGLAKERDFYFGKLRDIEVMCQDADNDDLQKGQIVQKILDVLYATEVIILIALSTKPRNTEPTLLNDNSFFFF